MKTIVRIFAIFLAVFSLVLTFASCGNKDDGNDDSGDKDNNNSSSKSADYTVNIIDEIGTPISDVFVSFTDENGNTIKAVSDREGQAVLYDAAVGKYIVTLEAGLSNVEIINSTYVMNKDDMNIDVVVHNLDKTMNIYGAVPDDAYAYIVSASEYNVVGRSGKMSYFVFSASIKGVYKFSFESSDPDMTVGWYGMPLYMQDHHIGDGEYNGDSFELTVQDVDTPYVVGLNFVNTSSATLKIERVSDAPFDPNFAPWTDVKAPLNIKKCDTTGKVLESIDISDSSLSVSLGVDGCYYTNTGKKVYIRITSDVEYGKTAEGKFVPLVGSLALLAGFVDQNIGGNVGGYIYDKNGNFVCKKLYNSMIQTYMDYVDDTYGVVEMTADLAECIQLNGESNGWWTDNGVGAIFDGTVVYPKNAWLIYCMVEK